MVELTHRGYRLHPSRQGLRCLLRQPDLAKSDVFPDRPSLPKLILWPSPEIDIWLEAYLNAVIDANLSFIATYERRTPGFEFGTGRYVEAVRNLLLFSSNRPRACEYQLPAVGTIQHLPRSSHITENIRLAVELVPLDDRRSCRVAILHCREYVIRHLVVDCGDRTFCEVVNRPSEFTRLGLKSEFYLNQMAPYGGVTKVSVAEMRRRIQNAPR